MAKLNLFKVKLIGVFLIRWWNFGFHSSRECLDKL